MGNVCSVQRSSEPRRFRRSLTATRASASVKPPAIAPKLDPAFFNTLPTVRRAVSQSTGLSSPSLARNMGVTRRCRFRPS
jgi:hypothetical protein